MCFSKLFRKGETNMQYTEKLELNLPEDDDYIESTSREALNDNFEVLDENVIVKDDLAIVTGSATLVEGAASAQINYPEGFTQTNCVVISFGCIDSTRSDVNQYAYGYGNHSTFYTSGCVFRKVSLMTNYLAVNFRNISASGEAWGSITINFKLVLMKIPTD